MEKQLAINVSTQINEWLKTNNSLYEIQKIETTLGTLHNFQQWTDGKPIIAAYHIQKIEEENYYLLFIDWHRSNKYYLVIYVGNKSTTAAEIREISEINEKPYLVWKYNPLKRDGKNQERKTYFKQVFGSLSVTIPLPVNPTEVEVFFDELYKLCRNRMRADRITEVFDI